MQISCKNYVDLYIVSDDEKWIINKSKYEIIKKYGNFDDIFDSGISCGYRVYSKDKFWIDIFDSGESSYYMFLIIFN